MAGAGRFLLTALVVAAALAAWPIAASAEDRGGEGGTVGVSKGTAQGSAGFNGSGTQANAHGGSSQGGTGSPTMGTGGQGTQPIVGLAGGASGVPNGPGGLLPAPGPQQGVPGLGPLQGPASAPAAPNPVVLAEEASASQPWPVLIVTFNPAVGLTGMTSSFWMSGNAQMPDVTASAGGLTVTVRATLSDVLWGFGDGGGFDAGTQLGRPYPAPNAIQHTYQTDSFGKSSGYVVTAWLSWNVTYSVNGGPFTELGTRTHPYSASYVVNQLQPQAEGSP